MKVYLTRSTANPERWGEIIFVAANSEESAREMASSALVEDRDSIEHVELTEMESQGDERVLHRIYLG